jgi:hypothetical protein
MTAWPDWLKFVGLAVGSGALALCWTVVVGRVARRLRWSPDGFRRFGVALLFAGVLLAVLRPSLSWLALYIELLGLATWFFARQIAYPHLSDRQIWETLAGHAKGH